MTKHFKLVREDFYHENLIDESSFERCTKTIILHGDDLEVKKKEIKAYFHNSFSLYEDLFKCLDKEGFYKRANPLRHPLIFYYAHTAVFFINKLNISKLISERIDEKIESQCAIGVDEMSWDDLNQAHYDWPTIAEVQAYRDKCRKLVERFIDECDVSLPINWTHPLWIVMMGIEHERIHLETSSVLIRELPLSCVKSHHFWGEICQDSSHHFPENHLLPVNGKRMHLGKTKEAELYGWDNEYGHAQEEVKNFSASKYLVSNGEFRAFVEDNGYAKKEFWTDEGQRWLSFSKATMPYFWRKKKDGMYLRTMLKEIPLPLNWPVEVNYLEAKAFCNWLAAKTSKPIRLPSEAEWYCLREKLETDQPYWNRAPGNINLEHDMSPCPVNRFEQAGGFFDIIGNVWQWTETPIDGFEGFEVHPSYDDFSTPTFDGKHNLFKGGCWISTGNYAIKDSRYAFRRHFFQHSGFRYVEGEALPSHQQDSYQKDTYVSQQLELHYGKKQPQNLPNFVVACVQEFLTNVEQRSFTKTLNIGCSVGRFAFELAQFSEKVEALDFSARMIEVPILLQEQGKVKYSIPTEGELVAFKDVNLHDFEGYESVKDRILFAQGDACNLKKIYNHYDLVFAPNLLERIYQPKKFLEDITRRIIKGGYLVLTSTYDWSETHTPKENWLGGYKSSNTGENQDSFDGITSILSKGFDLVKKPENIPFALRLSTRNLLYSVAEMSIWKKK